MSGVAQCHCKVHFPLHSNSDTIPGCISILQNHSCMFLQRTNTRVSMVFESHLIWIWVRTKLYIFPCLEEKKWITEDRQLFGMQVVVAFAGNWRKCIQRRLKLQTGKSFLCLLKMNHDTCERKQRNGALCLQRLLILQLKPLGVLWAVGTVESCS